jgi:hypothetical protein
MLSKSLCLSISSAKFKPATFAYRNDRYVVSLQNTAQPLDNQRSRWRDASGFRAIKESAMTGGEKNCLIFCSGALAAVLILAGCAGLMVWYFIKTPWGIV